MYDILTSIYCGELSGLKGKRPFERPYSIPEDRIQRRLLSMGPQAAEELTQEIRALAMEREERAFRSGACFGAQLALQLLDEF